MVGGLGYGVNELETALRRMQDPTYVATGPTTADIQSWWLATPVWIAILAAIVIFIASRHPDTLPKLRWPRLRR